jgi:tRNA (guanine26-N2/guanine27-N2)-dimethyltransferase
VIPVDILEGIDLQVVREGSVEVEVPRSTAAPRRGPARADGPVFYNPAMGLARDVSVAVLRAAGGPEWRVLDGLAGTGVRGVRYAVEGPPPREVVLNDRNPVAAALCRRNLDRNGVDAAVVLKERLETLLLRERFDMVDIDPFGSPVEFLPMALRSMRRGGVLAVTATDTPALCGSSPKPCLRRYGARPWRGDAMHEVALRILAGAVVREAARTDRAAVPILSMAEDHYVRVFLVVTEGARKADGTLLSIGYAWPTSEGGVATGDAPPEEGRTWTGPLWLGVLHSAELLENIARDDSAPRSNRFTKLLNLWREEADLPPLLLDANRVASRLGVPTPRMSHLVDELRVQGYAAGRASTNPVGFKTDAPTEMVEASFRRLGRQS